MVKLFYINEDTIVGIYVPHYHFSDVSLWQQHKLGERICLTLNQPQYTGNNKFVLLDSLVGDPTDNLPDSYIDDVMFHVMEMILDGSDTNNITEDKENILCFSPCYECLKFCTIKSQYLNLDPMKTVHYCRKCMNDIILPVLSAELTFDGE